MIDNLREKLSNLRLTVWKQTNLNGQANLDHDSVEEVLDLIRTEKLELLAEVRERLTKEDDILRRPTFGQTRAEIAIRNKLRKEQRIALTKLEAEL